MILPGESLPLPLEGLSWAISGPPRALDSDRPELIALLQLRERLRTWMTQTGAWGG